MGDGTMSAAQVVEIAAGLRHAGIRTWLIGGWGIDALLGRETRDHHDLDLLVLVADLPTLNSWLRDRHFVRQYAWPESRQVLVGGTSFDTAFVESHADGPELDVHAIEMDDQGLPHLATDDPWSFPPGSLAGHGQIDGAEVACTTPEAQVAMHRGYRLPPKHQQDLALLSEHFGTSA